MGVRAGGGSCTLTVQGLSLLPLLLDYTSKKGIRIGDLFSSSGQKGKLKVDVCANEGIRTPTGRLLRPLPLPLRYVGVVFTAGLEPANIWV